MEVEARRDMERQRQRRLLITSGLGAAILMFGLSVAVLIVWMDRMPSLPIFAAADWYAYRDIQDLWHPYREGIVFNPPWTYWLIGPLRLLPYPVGILRLLILLTFLALILRRGGRAWSVLAVMTSMPFLLLMITVNLDWLPALAFLIEDKGLALPFLLIKPQVGALAALAWLRKGGWRILLPTAVLLLLSFAVYGWWPSQVYANARHIGGNGLVHVFWNAAPFPWGAPLGAWALVRAWRREDEFAGVCATLLLAPYWSYYSMTVLYALAAGRARGWADGLAVAFFWCVMWLIYFVFSLGMVRL